MVRPPPNHERPPLVHRSTSKLDGGPLRIPPPSPRQPNRLHPIQPSPTESNPGNHHPDRLHPLRRDLHEPANEARLPLGRPLLGGGSLLRLPLVARPSSHHNPRNAPSRHPLPPLPPTHQPKQPHRDSNGRRFGNRDQL